MTMRTERSPAEGMCGAPDGLQPNPAESRVFDTDDMDRLRHGVAAALQALGFAADETSSAPLVIVGSQVAGPARRLTVQVHPCEEAQSIVRAEAEPPDQDSARQLVLDRFFEALSRAMYLTAHRVEPWQGVDKRRLGP